MSCSLILCVLTTFQKYIKILKTKSYSVIYKNISLHFKQHSAHNAFQYISNLLTKLLVATRLLYCWMQIFVKRLQRQFVYWIMTNRLYRVLSQVMKRWDSVQQVGIVKPSVTPALPFFWSWAVSRTYVSRVCLSRYSNSYQDLMFWCDKQCWCRSLCSVDYWVVWGRWMRWSVLFDPVHPPVLHLKHSPLTALHFPPSKTPVEMIYSVFLCQNDIFHRMKNTYHTNPFKG